MKTLAEGQRFRSVDSRRDRTVKITAINGDGTMVSLTNEATGRTTSVKASRLNSHGGYKPLEMPIVNDGNTPSAQVQQTALADEHDQHILDTASGEGMISRDEHPNS